MVQMLIVAYLKWQIYTSYVEGQHWGTAQMFFSFALLECYVSFDKKQNLNLLLLLQLVELEIKMKCSCIFTNDL